MATIVTTATTDSTATTKESANNEVTTDRSSCVYTYRTRIILADWSINCWTVKGKTVPAEEQLSPANNKLFRYKGVCYRLVRAFESPMIVMWYVSAADDDSQDCGYMIIDKCTVWPQDQHSPSAASASEHSMPVRPKCVKIGTTHRIRRGPAGPIGNPANTKKLVDAIIRYCKYIQTKYDLCYMIVTDYTKIPISANELILTNASIMAKKNHIRMVYAADYDILTTGTTQFSKRGFVPFYSCSWFNSLRGETALNRNKQIVRRGIRCDPATVADVNLDHNLFSRWNDKKCRNDCLRWIAASAKTGRSVARIGDCLRSIYDTDPAAMERNIDHLCMGLHIERYVGKTWIRRFDGGRITEDHVRVLDVPMHKPYRT